MARTDRIEQYFMDRLVDKYIKLEDKGKSDDLWLTANARGESWSKEEGEYDLYLLPRIDKKWVEDNNNLLSEDKKLIKANLVSLDTDIRKRSEGEGKRTENCVIIDGKDYFVYAVKSTKKQKSEWLNTNRKWVIGMIISAVIGLSGWATLIIKGCG